MTKGLAGVLRTLLVLAALLGARHDVPPSLAPPVLAARAGAGSSVDAPLAQDSSIAETARITATMVTRRVRFEANLGQWDERVRFVARHGGATLFLTDEGMTVGLRDVKWPGARPGAAREEEAALRDQAVAEARSAAVTLRLVGARKGATHGEEELVTRSNFFLGDDATKWRTDVPNYAKVRARGWLPGVEVVWHGAGEGGGLEYSGSPSESVTRCSFTRTTRRTGPPSPAHSAACFV